MLRGFGEAWTWKGKKLARIKDRSAGWLEMDGEPSEELVLVSNIARAHIFLGLKSRSLFKVSSVGRWSRFAIARVEYIA